MSTAPIQKRRDVESAGKRLFRFIGTVVGTAGLILTAGAMPAPASTPLANSAARAADGDLPVVISGGTDHAIKRWNASGKLVDTFGALGDSVNVLRLMANGTIVSGGADGLVKTWSTADAHEVRTIEVSKAPVASIAVAPDGSLIAVGSADGQITTWNAVTGKRLAEMEAHGSGVQALQFTSDGAVLISGSADKTIRFWKVVHTANKNEMDRLEYRSNISAHDDPITAIALSPQDELLATVSEDGWLKTWRLDGGLVGRMHVCDRGVASVAFSPDGRTLATGDNEGRIRFWNARTSAPLMLTLAHEKDRPVYALAFTPNGKVLVSGGADGTIRYWNMETGQKLKSIAAHDGAVKALLLVP